MTLNNGSDLYPCFKEEPLEVHLGFLTQQTELGVSNLKVSPPTPITLGA